MFFFSGVFILIILIKNKYFIKNQKQFTIYYYEYSHFYWQTSTASCHLFHGKQNDLSIENSKNKLTL